MENQREMKAATVTKRIVQGLAILIGLMGLEDLFFTGLFLFSGPVLSSLILALPMAAMGLLMLLIAHFALFRFSPQAIATVTGMLGLTTFLACQPFTAPYMAHYTDIENTALRLTIAFGPLLAGCLVHIILKRLFTKLAFPKPASGQHPEPQHG